MLVIKTWWLNTDIIAKLIKPIGVAVTFIKQLIFINFASFFLPSANAFRADDLHRLSIIAS